MSAKQSLNTSSIDKSGQGKLDFEHFLKFLEILAEKIFPQIDVSSAFIFLIDDFILPLQKANESRCV